jgi:hypothetical protein
MIVGYIQLLFEKMSNVAAPFRVRRDAQAKACDYIGEANGIYDYPERGVWSA